MSATAGGWGSWGDLEFDPCTGQIKAIVVPGPGCICGFLGREKEYVIPFGNICRIGDDIVFSQAGRKDKEGMKMKCPYCGAQDTKVIDSRPADDNSAIRRRRQCEQCGKRFTHL